MKQASLHQDLCKLDQARFLVDYLRSQDFHVGIAESDPFQIELHARYRDTPMSLEVLSQLTALRAPLLTVLKTERKPTGWKRRRGRK